MQAIRRISKYLRSLLGAAFTACLVMAPSACAVGISGSPEVSQIATRSTGEGFEVRRFAFSLTQLNIGAIARSDTDLVVVEAGGLSAATVARLKRRPDGGRRLVLGYMNVGEAETYRSYWRSAWNRNRPEWVGKPNRDWPDHFYVQYWTPEWQRILMGTRNSALDRILAAGFDGVFLDSVDKYQVWSGRLQRSKSDMINLVKRIGTYGRARNSRFLVVPNNAEDLLSNAGYRRSIDAVVKESLFFGVPGPGRRNSPQLVNWSLRQLRRAQRDGRPIFVIEYLGGGSSQAEAAARIRDAGMLATFGRRDLARLTRPATATDNAVRWIRRVPGPR